MTFNALTLAQMAHVLAIARTAIRCSRSASSPTRRWSAAVMLTFVLQVAVIYVPFLQRLFDTTPLSAVELIIAFAVSSTILWAIELQKLVVRRRGR